MKEITVLEKYPVLTLEIGKKDTQYKNIDEIFTYLKMQIEAHPIATYIGEFDHYSHTTSLEEGKIWLKIYLMLKTYSAVLVKYCLKPEVLAVRPRAIGVAEMSDSFVVSFMEAPNPDANAAMKKWVEGIATR